MTAHLYIYGDIASPTTGGPAPPATASLQSVVNSLQAQQPYNHIVLHVHSRGGDVAEGFAIYNYLRSLGTPITSVIEGLCASIATVVALAGHTRQMHRYAEVFIHNPWGNITGNAQVLNTYAAELQKAETKLLDFYTNATRAPRQTLQHLMHAETTLTAAEAMKLGFVQSLINQPKAFAMLHVTNEADNALNQLKTLKNHKLSMTKAQTLARMILNFLGQKTTDKPQTLADGQTIFIAMQGKSPQVGDAVYLGPDETAPPAPEGAYELTDGTVIDVDDQGLIVAVTPANPTEDPKTLEAQNRALQAKVKRLEAAEQTVAQQLEQIKARLQSNYTPKPRFRDTFAHSQTPDATTRNRAEEAKERRNQYGK